MLAEGFDSQRDGLAYTVHSHVDYRPCDVQPGQARVCELLTSGARTGSAEECAQLCTCLREINDVYCNAATWGWREVGSDESNCFPRFIEGIKNDGALPQDACSRSSGGGGGPAFSMLVLRNTTLGASPAYAHRCPEHHLSLASYSWFAVS